MKNILVPLDGSPIAEFGLRAASRVASETGAEIVLLRAVRFSIDAENEDAQYDHSEIREASTYLEEVRQRLIGQGLVARSLVLPGNAVPAILFAAEIEKADLISMATHGRGRILGRLLGSVTSAVLRATERPVLIARAGAAPRDETGPMHTILVGLDGSPFAESALSYLHESGIGRDACTLLAQGVEAGPVAPAMGLISEKALERIVADARLVTEQRLENAEQYLRATGIEKLPRRRTLVIAMVGEPASILVDVAVGEHADLVVLATHGRRGMDWLVHGSVASSVLRHCQSPVLIVHGVDAVAHANQKQPSLAS